ncbi:hypothetical protein DFQ28_001567 [Apophysomyces sp. BC1034]|nr:hypothetical protein DFQ28_001567 [Apophysomyces sp. BC1034]
MVSQQAPPPFLDGLIDHEQGRDDEALDRVVGWMEDDGFVLFPLFSWIVLKDTGDPLQVLWIGKHA